VNIYLIVEDGQQFCIKAINMGEAVKLCLDSYLEEREGDIGYKFDDIYKNEETGYYHGNILESCSLVGELKN